MNEERRLERAGRFAIQAPRVIIYGGPQAKSIAAAIEDFTAGIQRYSYWHNLAWNDVKTRYRRSLLGEFWMTINLAVFIVSVGVVYGALLHMSLSDYLPQLTIGYALWLLFSSLTVDGCQTFIVGSGTLRQQRIPLTAFVLRNVDRAFIAFAHNFVIIVIVLALCRVRQNWNVLLFIPGLCFWWLNGMWLSLIAGMLSARFRDVPQIVANFVQILFLISPVLWSDNNVPSSLQLFSRFNPITHFLIVVRDPLLGLAVPPVSWAIVAAITTVGWIAAGLTVQSYRTRVPLWV